MKIRFAQYEHNAIGFPGVVLKWAVKNGELAPYAYVTVNGVIQRDPWQWCEQHPLAFMKSELARFDTWTRERFSENASVQG